MNNLPNVVTKWHGGRESSQHQNHYTRAVFKGWGFKGYPPSPSPEIVAGAQSRSRPMFAVVVSIDPSFV